MCFWQYKHAQSAFSSSYILIKVFSFFRTNTEIFFLFQGTKSIKLQKCMNEHIAKPKPFRIRRRKNCRLSQSFQRFICMQYNVLAHSNKDVYEKMRQHPIFRLYLSLLKIKEDFRRVYNNVVQHIDNIEAIRLAIPKYLIHLW